MADLILTALYDSADTAQSARDALVAAGVPSADILVHSGTMAGERQADAGRLAGVSLPHADRQLYAEGVRRGGHVVSVRVSDAMEDEATAALERFAPLDLEEHERTWRAEGWQTDDTTVPPEEDARRVGGMGESIAYASTAGSAPRAAEPVTHTGSRAGAGGLAEPAGTSYVARSRRVRRHSVVPPGPVTSNPP